MYAAEAHTGIQVVLNERLEQDDDGTLRDRLTDELLLAGEEIERALIGPLPPADVAVLKGLLEAVRLSENVVWDVWHAFHR